MTACTLRISVSDTSTTTLQERDGPWQCSVRLNSARSESHFLPAKSWVREGTQSSALLAHEQIHFDMTHIQGTRAVARLQRELASKTYTSQGADERSAEDAARGKFKRDYDRIIAEEQAALVARNKQYDADTAHGMKPDEQKRWATMIARELRDLGERRRAP